MPRVGSIFGGPNGLNVFDPAHLQENPHIPPVVLTNFQLPNQDAPIGPNSPLQRHISMTDTITLTHDQARFSFEFAALNYTIPAKNQYAYMLAGFDEDWIVTDSQRRFARYTNLDPGEYIFRVKASNNDGVWNEQGVSVKIIILPPLVGNLVVSSQRRSACCRPDRGRLSLARKPCRSPQSLA